MVMEIHFRNVDRARTSFGAASVLAGARGGVRVVCGLMSSVAGIDAPVLGGPVKHTQCVSSSLCCARAAAVAAGHVGHPRAAAARRQPIVTGTSVLAVKYVDGVMLAADTLGALCVIGGSPPPPARAEEPTATAGSYGSMAMFTKFERLVPVGGGTLLGASGDMSDFQAIQDMLEELRCVVHVCVGGGRRRGRMLRMEDHCAADGIVRGPAAVYTFLSRVMYNRRTKARARLFQASAAMTVAQGDPLWNSVVVAGWDRVASKPYARAAPRVAVRVPTRAVQIPGYCGPDRHDVL